MRHDAFFVDGLLYSEAQRLKYHRLLTTALDRVFYQFCRKHPEAEEHVKHYARVPYTDDTIRIVMSDGKEVVYKYEYEVEPGVV